MKKIPLLPIYFKWIGWVMVLISLSLFGYSYTHEGISLEVRTFVVINDFPFGRGKDYFQLSSVDIYLTLLLALSMLGFAFVAFSKRKLEDEMINFIRLRCWSWAIIAVLLIYFATTVLVYGIPFISFSFVLPQLLLVIFIILFHVNLYQLSRRKAHEE